MTGKVECGSETANHSRKCPSCGGESIKFGIQVWSRKNDSRYIQRWQRMKCKKCKQLWYYFIEAVSTLKGGRNRKPINQELVLPLKASGVGGSAKRKEKHGKSVERNNA